MSAWAAAQGGPARRNQRPAERTGGIPADSYHW